MTVREQFEAYWKERFSFEMRRGEGRSGYGLKRDPIGKNYISDKAQFAWTFWCEAKGGKVDE